MEPEARYTVVGTVVLALLSLLAAAVVWLHGSSSGPAARVYRIAFAHQSLEGLTRSSSVTMRGLAIGSVTGYSFSRQHPGTVDVLIAVDPAAPVQEGTRATIGRNLLTGLATVQLSNPSVASPPLRPAAGGAPPLIAEGVAPEQQIVATATDLVQRLNMVLSPQNRAALSATLDNMQRLSGHADRTMNKLDTSLDTLNSAAGRIGALADSVRTDARTLTGRYDALGAQAVRTMADAGQTVRHADALLLRSDQDLRATTRSLRAAADSIGLAADRLREPSDILYGPGPGKLGPGEGRR